MLTRKQHDLLRFIHERLEETGVAPSFDEMKEALGLKSKSGVHRLVTALEERGFVRRLPHRARALEVLRLPPELELAGRRHGDGPAAARGRDGTVVSLTGRQLPHSPSTVDIPLHGRIAAGTPIEALEEVDNHVAIPADWLRSTRPHFALTVEGDSMIEAGILDGDIAIIESCDIARDGEIVVALVDRSEATLKILKRLGQHVALIPANRRYETRMVEADRVRIQGRLVALLRRYH
ncbi:MAG: transcriptional repressor LexA [Alphaproteobacteria bacterium]|nr:MAG: transcriptional repressor LexA [Alphaproteobacteria bacterium]